MVKDRESFYCINLVYIKNKVWILLYVINYYIMVGFYSVILYVNYD